MSNSQASGFKSARPLDFSPADGYVPSYRKQLATMICKAKHDDASKHEEAALQLLKIFGATFQNEAPGSPRK